jgi:lysophospholipid acyltransferase
LASQQLDKAQISSRIVQFPSILEFLGHAYVTFLPSSRLSPSFFRLYFPGLLVGHSSDFNKYKAMCDGTLYEGAKGEDATRHVPRGRKRVAARKAAMGLAFIAAYAFLSPRFSYPRILRDEWLDMGRLERCVLRVRRRDDGSQGDDRLLEVQLIGVVERTKYYGAWSLAEASPITCARTKTYMGY